MMKYLLKIRLRKTLLQTIAVSLLLMFVSIGCTTITPLDNVERSYNKTKPCK